MFGMLVYLKGIGYVNYPHFGGLDSTPSPPSFQAISRLQRWIAQGHQGAKAAELVGLVVAALIEPAAKLL